MARVPLIVGKEQVAPEHHAIVDSIVGSRGALHGPFSVFLHSPEIAGRVAHLGALVRFESTLKDVPADDALIIEYTRTLLRKHRIPADMDKKMRDRFGNDQMIQLSGA